MTSLAELQRSAATDDYLVFCGMIDGIASNKFANALTVAAKRNKKLHLAIQTPGGSIADGVFIYNLFRSTPIDLTVYNIGSVASAGVVAFIGAPGRCVS